MKIKRFNEDNVNESHITEKAEDINKMFDNYLQKLSFLQTGLGKLKPDDHDKIIQDLMTFFGEIKEQYIDQWKEVEGSFIIVDHLEKKIVELGGDLEKTKKEIGFKLVKAMK